MVKWRPIQISLTLLIHFSYSQYQEYPHWVRFSVNNIDKNRWFSFYCYFFASNVQLFERECQWFEFQRCERKRKMVNYRDKLSWTGNKWETLEMADSVLFFCVCKHKTALIFAPYAIWRALRAEQCGGHKQPRRNKKIDTKKEIVTFVVKTDGKLDDEWRWVEVYMKWNEPFSHFQRVTEVHCMAELNIWIIKTWIVNLGFRVTTEYWLDSTFYTFRSFPSVIRSWRALEV